jgi:hypothetical protein
MSDNEGNFQLFAVPIIYFTNEVTLANFIHQMKLISEQNLGQKISNHSYLVLWLLLINGARGC